jgi:hypothetical protein
MRRNHLIAIGICSLAWSGYANTSAYAGWFGPSTFSECVLGKTKAQKWMNNDIMEFIEKDCDTGFPCARGTRDISWGSVPSCPE